MLYEGYQWVHIVLDNGLSGTSPRPAHNRRAQLTGGKEQAGQLSVLIDFDDSFECVSSSTDTGGSGGLGPLVVTLLNQIATY